jgi:acyl-coenzyme A synthetase/AMP-(fatty) acid ligase
MCSQKRFESLDTYLEYFSKESPDKTFVFELKRNLGLSYKKTNELVNSLCHFFQKRGFKQGDIITLYLDNNLELVLLLLASLRFGTVAFLYPSLFIPAELKKDLELIPSKAVFVSAERAEEFRTITRQRLIVVKTQSQNGLLDKIAGLNGRYDQQEIRPEDNALLYQSSGAACQPRGIYYTHGNLAALIPSVCRGFRFSETDIHLIGLPLAHSAALNYSLFPVLMSGGSVILADSFWNIRDSFWKVCGLYGVSYVEVVPTVLYMLYHLSFDGRDRSALKTIKYIGCGSAPLSESLQMEFEKNFGLPAANLYGLTETGPTHVDYPLSEEWRRGTIGRPLDVNRVTILDEDGKECNPGEKGEIAVKGENVFPGYAVWPELTRKCFKQDYFCTGDIGLKDREEYFYFCGIKKELIIRGGINIHPDEINEVILSHPQVKKCRTEGIPNDFFGEQIKTFIVLKTKGAISEKELKAYCSRFLSPIKIPDFVAFVKEIPDTR